MSSDYLGPEDHIDWSAFMRPPEPQFHYDAEAAIAAGPNMGAIWVGKCGNPECDRAWHGLPNGTPGGQTRLSRYCAGSHLYEGHDT